MVKQPSLWRDVWAGAAWGAESWHRRHITTVSSQTHHCTVCVRVGREGLRAEHGHNYSNYHDTNHHHNHNRRHCEYGHDDGHHDDCAYNYD